MKCFLFCLILLSQTKVWAKGRTYKIQGQYYHVQFSKGITASPRCFKTESCMAMNEARKLKGTKKNSSINGKNPLSLLCKDRLNSKVVVGSNEEGEEVSFCLFPDQSVISCASLGEFF
ncbi:MAG: hypothetical protein ACOYL6_05080 [Bacteriovoracaceae bacterium]